MRSVAAEPRVACTMVRVRVRLMVRVRVRVRVSRAACRAEPAGTMETKVC